MELNNDSPDIDLREPIDSSQLSYKDNTRDDQLVSKAADSNSTENLQRGTPKPRGGGSPINNSNSILQDTLNIQLPYDINQAMDQDAWDGDFHPISIHGLMEHLHPTLRISKLLFVE